MADTVTVSGREITIERFTLAKASRVITLLQLLQKQVPEVSKAWAEYRKAYAKDYEVELSRMQAMAQFGPALEHITEADWEREGQLFRVPGRPSPQEVFFELAPLVYERGEKVALRLLGIIAIDNATVQRYVETGDIWARVDEFVADVIQAAALDELIELVVTAAEVVDTTIIAKVKSLGNRAGNVARLFGMTTSSEDPSGSQTSSSSPAQPNTVTFTDSQGSTPGGPPTSSSDSPSTDSSTSSVSPSETTIRSTEEAPA